MRVLGVIPARGGSKTLPRKNILPVAGKPLIGWTIEAALQARCLDRVILSSEDPEIISVARQYGCEVPFQRPPGLARDDTAGVEPILHALSQVEGYDYVVVLQPTSPLRTAEDITSAVDLCLAERAASCTSVTASEKPIDWMFRLLPNGLLTPAVPEVERSYRRQDAPMTYTLNGAIYVAAAQRLQRTRRLVDPDTLGYVMPAIRSVDVDTQLDLRWCDFLLKEVKNAD